MQFDLDRNIDGAALDVQSSISASARRLPADLPNPPSFRKVNPADQPILFLVLDVEHPAALDRQRLRRDGPAAADLADPRRGPGLIFGSQKYAVRIMVDPAALSARGLTFSDLRSAVSAANSNQPTGTLRGERQRVTIEATGQLRRASRLRRSHRLLEKQRPDPP